eukprot:2164640-Prymnesium_polylepis.1
MTTRQDPSCSAGTAHATVTSLPRLTRHDAHGGGGGGGSAANDGRTEGVFVGLESARARGASTAPPPGTCLRERRRTMLRAEALAKRARAEASSKGSTGGG